MTMKMKDLIQLLQEKLNPNDVVSSLVETENAIIVNSSLIRCDPGVKTGRTYIFTKTEQR